MKVIVPNDSVKANSKEVKNFLKLLKKGKAYKISFIHNKDDASLFIFKSSEIIKNSIVRINFYSPIMSKIEEYPIYESMTNYGLGNFFDILSGFEYVRFTEQELTLPRINENFLLRIEFLKNKKKNKKYI